MRLIKMSQAWVAKILVLLFITTFCVKNICCENSNDEKQSVIVETKLGKIEGFIEKEASFKGKDYISFHGIPFAKPPIGDLRFEKAEPVERWQGVYKANKPTTCIQLGHIVKPDPKPYGDEDCLYLNIFVPGVEIPNTQNLDVIVHIHGGGFMFGGGYNIGEKYLIDHNIILVTINYGLGILGFLSSEDDIIPGNNGLKDQALALQWLKHHIDAFGGNPQSITIIGLSAGGASVHYQMHSPQSAGLFHRAISQSGVALNPWAMQDKAREKFLKLAKILHCHQDETDNIDGLLIKDCLKRKSALEIVTATTSFQHWYCNPFSPFAPVVDEWASDAFLPEHPYKLLKEKRLRQDVPWLTSMTTAEGLYPAADFINGDFKLFHELDNKWDDVLHYVLHHEDVADPQRLQEINRRIRQFYFNPFEDSFNEIYQPLDSQHFQTLIQLIGDRLFLADFDTAVKLHTEASKSNVWVYSYNYSATNVFRIAFLHQDEHIPYGVGHGDDTVMIFDLPKAMKKDTKREGSDLEMTEFLLNMIVNFSKSGNPGVKNWTPMKDSNQIEYYDIQNPQNMAMKNAEEFGNNLFWESLEFQENERYQRDNDPVVKTSKRNDEL